MNRDQLMICIFIAMAVGIFCAYQSVLEDKKLDADVAAIKKVIVAAKRPRVISFTSPWHAPCQQFKPVLKKVMMNYSQSVDCEIINVDAPGNTDMIRSFSVKSIPATYIFDRNGNLVFKHIGYVNPEELDYYLRKVVL